MSSAPPRKSRSKARLAGAFVAAMTLAALGVTASVAVEQPTDAVEPAGVAEENATGAARLPDLVELPGPPDTLGVQQEVENEGEQRSPVAEAVHEALAGSEGPRPTDAEEDDDFGQAVAQNAREGGAAFGLGVASAATEAAEANTGIGDDDLEAQGHGGGPPEGAGPPEGVGPPEGLELGVPPGRD